MENELRAKESELIKSESEIKKISDSMKNYKSQETDLDKNSRIFVSKIYSLEVSLSETENNIKNLECGHIRVLVMYFFFILKFNKNVP